MKRLGWTVLAVLAVAGCGGSDEPAPAPTATVGQTDGVRLGEQVELFGESVGADFAVPDGSIAVTEVVEDSPGRWRAEVTVTADSTVTEPLVFDGTFTAAGSDDEEYTPVEVPEVLEAWFVGGGSVVFIADGLRSVTYTTTDGVSFIWSL